MAKTHYETLGLTPEATLAQVKAAYRKLVLQHHPDRSSRPESKAIFLAVSEAYQVLSDADRRRQYDAMLNRPAPPRPAPPTTAKASPTTPPRPRPNADPPPPRAATPPPVAAEVARLTTLYGTSRYVEAESLARLIIGRDPRQPIPYAILGDLARARGNLEEAAKMYAFAVQMDGRNATFQRRHEEVLDAISRRKSTAAKMDAPGASPLVAMAPAIGFALSLLGAIYVSLAREAPIFTTLQLVSTWTLGLLVMLFLSGVSLGATLSMARWLDRFSATTVNAFGRLTPTFALGFVAIVNFWAAAFLMLLIGGMQRALHQSTMRLVGVAASATVLYAAAAGLGGRLDPLQVLIWGGNLVYLGALCGWMVADAFQP